MSIALSFGGEASATTDREGRYELRGLEPGSYQVFARAEGYLERAYGRQNASRSGTSIVVQGGYATTGITIALARAGVIHGRVFDESGNGLAGVEVGLLTQRYGPTGREWSPTASALTDASGLFHVQDLSPGEYLVGAHTSQTPPDNPFPYALTYFPGTTRREDGQALTLGSGQEMFGVDFSLLSGEPLSVSGIVLAPSGEPLPQADILVASLGPGSTG